MKLAYKGTFFPIKPNKFLKNYRKYSPESLIKAYEIVKSKRISVEKAARMFCIPAQTLCDQINGNGDPRNCRVGPETVLTSSQEEVLVSHVETMADLAYGYTNTKLKHLAGEMAYDLHAKSRNTNE